jgi:hypothetical protein
MRTFEETIMTPEDYIEYLKGVNWSNYRQAQEAQAIAADDITLSSIYQQYVQPPRDPDDFVVDMYYGDD